MEKVVDLRGKLSEDSVILTLCKEVYDMIYREGAIHENTKELVNVYFGFGIEDLDMAEEERLVRNYYGERYEKRAGDERFHYEQIRYSLLHKIKEIQYFFSQGIENRKTVVFSNDCISLVQYIKRGKETILLVYMRSSDVLELLPLDLLNLAKILKDINREYIEDGTELLEDLSLTIGSAHYYLTGGRQ
jgi:thymidylate synthase